MINEAMRLIQKKMSLLAIEIYWYRNSTKYASTYIVLDRLADDVKELESLFAEVWKKDSKVDEVEFVKSLYERYGGNGFPKIQAKTLWGEMAINEKKERDEGKSLPEDDRVPQGRIR